MTQTGGTQSLYFRSSNNRRDGIDEVDEEWQRRLNYYGKFEILSRLNDGSETHTTRPSNLVESRVLNVEVPSVKPLFSEASVDEKTLQYQRSLQRRLNGSVKTMYRF